jgi:hypothetical protein
LYKCALQSRIYNHATEVNFYTIVGVHNFLFYTRRKRERT